MTAAHRRRSTVARVRRSALVTVVAAFACLSLAGPSSAAVRFGSDLQGNVSFDRGCDDISCTRMLLSVNGTEIRSPIDGVVVRWRALGEGLAQLQVMRRDADGAWRAVAASAPEQFTPRVDLGEW